MKFMDIINPWGALKRANLTAKQFGAECERIEALHVELAHLVTTQNTKIRRLEKIIADGHYRNPKTGRLGRKGEVFTK